MTTTQPDAEGPSTRAVLSLVFGALGVAGFLCVGPILAIVLGLGQQGGVAKAGVILGWIGLAWQALAFGMVLLLILVGGVAALPFVH